jgi:hypothetical protein
MNKITLLSLFLFSISGFSQSKSTAIIALNADMTAQFTLNNTTSKVTLVLTGPSAKWSSLGIGTASSTTTGDVFVYTTTVTDNTATSSNSNQDWNTVSNTVSSDVRTITLERVLSNSDLNDLQLAFDTTNSIDVVWSRSGTAIATAPNANRGSINAAFTTTLGIDSVLLNNEVILYPNPTSGELYIKTKNNISKVNVYNQTGALVKTINLKDNSNEVKVNVNDLPKALYLFELQNESEKTWKKVIVN